MTTKVHTVEEERRLPLEALVEVDAYQVIDHQTVLAWAASPATPCPLSVEPLPGARLPENIYLDS
jgi:hypothetical protein